MKKRDIMPLRFVCLIVLSLGSAGVARGDWPQFQGPDRNGISPVTGLMRHFPEGGPALLWQVDVGPGYGGAAVKDKKVYFLDRIDSERDVIRCHDFDTGKELWRVENQVAGRVTYDGSRSVPTVDEFRLYTVGPLGHFYCVDIATRKILWTKDQVAIYKMPPNTFGYGYSPLLYNDWVILTPAGSDTGIVALDQSTGKEIWRSGSVGYCGNCFVSAILTNLDGREGILYNTCDTVSFIDPQTGETLWSHGGLSCVHAIASPTAVGSNRVFVTCYSYKGGSMLLEITNQNNTYDVKQIKQITPDGSLLYSALFYDDYLYVNFTPPKDAKYSSSGLVCLDRDGNTMWKTGPKPEFALGHAIIADGMILILGSDNGRLYLVEINPTKFVLLDSTRLLNEGNNFCAPMALADGRLLLRDQKNVKCFNLKTNRIDSK
jgi:outer membrane protein assembly factor BamB